MPLRYKYSIADWVLSQDNVTPGDIIAYFCDEEQKEIQAEVIDFPSKEKRQIITCRRLDTQEEKNINFYDTIVYRINYYLRDQVKKEQCSCGAKYTSNPKYHLPYCHEAAS